MKYKEIKRYHHWSINCFSNGKFIGHIGKVLDHDGTSPYFWYDFSPSKNGRYGNERDGIRYKSVEEIKNKLELNEKTYRLG